ncbi:MAG: ABC-type Mn2+/Zn2+ transport system permease subunit [Verrucomicrobiales bacterium]|jgi:ABC-type Mn2+/Zn2+ transport system permease subunit/Mn-dependent DtxR family transcriptional regulator
MARVLRAGVITIALVVSAASLCPADAGTISSMTETSALDQTKRFFEFRDNNVIIGLIGCTLLGIMTGMLGSFVLVRKMALMGDAISHAVLPGVAAGFLWNMEKDPVAIFIGAVIAGLLGAGTVRVIRDTTQVREDAALGLVLAGFFAVGAIMLDFVNHLPIGDASGLKGFLFGSAAALRWEDVRLIGGVTIVSVMALFIFYRQFLVTSFDQGFSRSIGVPIHLFHYALMLLLAFAVVVSLQAVGVVLVSALLITPAAAAYLLTDRLATMIVVASFIGALSAVSGYFVAFVFNVPTGPAIVMAATAVFAVVFFFAPRHGLLRRWLFRRSESRRVQRENTLKAMFHVLEGDASAETSGVIDLAELAEKRNESADQIRQEVAALQRKNLATVSDDGRLYFTPSGEVRAREVVRNHRLWELYLTESASIAPDHVHDDAEKIEHVLGGDVVDEMLRQLDYADTDPHGKTIPLADAASEELPDR